MGAGNKIANIYAESLLDSISEKSDLIIVEEELQSIIEALFADVSVKKFFESPVIKVDEKMSVLASILKGKINEILYSFINVVTARKRLNMLVEIGSAFTSMVDRELNRKRVSISVAKALVETERKMIVKALGNYLNAEVVMEESLNANLIGGMVIRSGDLLIDTSLHNSLNRIKLSLLQQKTIGTKFYEN